MRFRKRIGFCASIRNPTDTQELLSSGARIPHDAGILYVQSGPVVMVVLTNELKNNRDGVRLVGRIGKRVFDQFS